MPKLNDEIRELSTGELNAVAGGTDAWVPTGYAAIDAYHVISEMKQDTANVLAAAGLTKH